MSGKKEFLFIAVGITILLSLAFVSSCEMNSSEFSEAKKLVESKISCDNLTDKQLESIGDYLMEVMHPGESHEQMHEIMGGEENENVKTMHISMAQMLYCNKGKNMMSMMSGEGMMGSSGMMGSRMMSKTGYKNMIWNYNNDYLNSAIKILFSILLVLLIIFMIKQIQRKK